MCTTTRPGTSGIPVLTHEHAWTTESAHPTSEGAVVYVRCAGCGARRVDLRTAIGMPPSGMSRVVDARS